MFAACPVRVRQSSMERAMNRTRIMSTAITGLAMVALTTGAAFAASRCSGDKIKASGKKAASQLTCHSKAVAKGLPVDSTCLAKADAKFSIAFTKAEAKTYVDAGCLTTGDGGPIETQIDGFVAAVASRLSGDPYCGDGIIGGGEDCDGANLGGATCASLGYSGGGSLACTPGCAFDTTACGCALVSSCGNGVKDGNEQCDGSDLGG